MTSDRMTPPHGDRRAPSLAAAARGLVQEARRGVLCTLTSEDGFPYGSLVELLPLGSGDIILFLSRLAEHQHYLEADARVSIVIVPHIFDEHAMARPRVTLLGRIEPVADRSSVSSAYVALHPDAANYIDFPDFQFYRLRPERVRYIAGFGRMGWITGGAYRGAP